MKLEFELTIFVAWFINELRPTRPTHSQRLRQWLTKLENKATLFMSNPDKRWIIHELRLLQMRGAVDEAVVLSTANPLQQSSSGEINSPEG
ncbi:MAG: hypothetical protein WBE11_14610 [Candidatus Aminicenantaceae bacterium]